MHTSANASRRFDDQRHLDEWKASGVFPQIHDDIFWLVCARARGRHVLDLACSTGLLAQRLRGNEQFETVHGIDTDMDALLRGTAAGIKDLTPFRVAREKYRELCDLLEEWRIDVVVARRCLPEILGDGSWGREFAATLATAGVRDLFIEGRVLSKRSTAPLRHVDLEVRALGNEHFIEMGVWGNTAHLARFD